MYHQRYMEESHRGPEVVPTVDQRDWPNTLEKVEDYIRGFSWVNGQPLSYEFSEDLIAAIVASDPTYRNNGSDYFMRDEEMIAQGLILSGPAALETDPEEMGPFTHSFITNRAFICYRMVAIFQESDAWTYFNPANKHRDGSLGFRLIYNHYLSPRNRDHMADGADKKLSWCSYTG